MSASRGAARIPGSFSPGPGGLQTFAPDGVVWNAAGVASVVQAPTFGAAVAIDVDDGSAVVVVATSNIAFTIGAPSNAVAGQVLGVTIRNSSGGALGVATFNAAFHLAGAWVQPANNQQRTVTFRYDGAVWYELARNAADVPV